MTHTLKNKAKKDIKLSDYIEYTEEEVSAVFNQLRNEIRRKVSMAQVREYAEPKIIESPTPPPIESGENAKWIDTSGEIKVPHVVIGDEWVKMSPTEAQEVGTYDASAIDDKASDASLLDKGIVDVGQVPLRTSVSGDRIEWDGVNGLVQYDQQGRTTSQIDLDGNARFANAFVTGRVEATEGYFGKNKRVTIGDDGLTIQRPDDAVWMENGLVVSDYVISQYDPHLTTQKIYDANGTRSSLFADQGGSIAVDGWYTARFAWADGRSSSNVLDGFRDVRDADLGYTIRFQRYEFTHSARYLVFVYQIANNSIVGKHRVRIYEVGTPPQGSTEIYYNEDFEEGDRGVKTLIVDLGTPTYEVRRFDFRIGHLKQWGPADKYYRFRVPRMYQRDYI